MKHTFKKLMEDAQKRKFSTGLNKFIEKNGIEDAYKSSENFENAVRSFDEATEYMYGLYTGQNFDGKRVSLDSIPLSEAQTTADYSVLLRRVIDEQMLMPKAPRLFLRELLTKTIEVADNVAYVEFPTMATFNADWMAEAGPYPDGAPAFGENLISLKLRKMGVKVTFSEELIRSSIYPLMGLWLQEGRNSVERKKESYLSEIMRDSALVKFNNDSATTSYHTSGVDEAQVNNFSLSYWDMTDMCAELVKNRMTPTDLLIHPFGWRVIADDPLMRSWSWTTGNTGANWNAPVAVDQTAMTPLGLNFVPYYDVDFSVSYTLNSANVSGNALAAAAVTDAYIVDRNNCLIAGERPLSMAEVKDEMIDASVILLKTYFEASAVDQGRGMVRAKSIRIVRNYEPSYTIRSVN